MKNLAAILTTLFLVTTAFAQIPETDQEASQAISKLDFIVGNWSGKGWMIGRDGERHSFTQTENIQFKLDSTVILIEGLGKNNGVIIHNALAIVSYNKTDKNYIFRSYLSTGQGGEFTGELMDGKFYWYPNENMRYIIYINDLGQWYETGEIKRENGWFQFLEMTLVKQ